MSGDVNSNRQLIENSDLLYLLSCLPVEVVVRDYDTKILYANEAFGSTYKCTAAEVIGRYDRELWIEHGRTTAEAQRWLNEDRSIIDTGKSIQYIERIQREDGSLGFFHNIKQRITLSDGRDYLLAIYFDITDQEILEEDLHRIQLKAAERGGVQKTAVTYAHKINSPLSGILGLAQIVAERDDIDDEVRQTMREIQQAVKDISAVVDKLVSITNPRTITYTGKTERIDEDSK